MSRLGVYLSLTLYLWSVKGQENPCTDYVSSRASLPCNATLNACFYSSEDSPVQLLDACLFGIHLEEKDDKGLPNGNLSGDVGSPVVGQPAVPTSFPGHPLLGSLTGRDEPMFHLRPLVPMQPAELSTRFHLYTTSYQNGREAMAIHYSSPETIAQLAARQFPIETLDLLFDYKGGHDGSRARPTDVTGVLLVDWREGAKARNEPGKFARQAVVNTMIVGREIGLLLYLMVKSSHILVREEDIHLIGNGLGAQVMHFAAKYYKELANKDGPDNSVGENDPIRKLGRLTALDPYAPHYQGFTNLAGNVPHVHFQDATFVDVIHTDSSIGTRSAQEPRKGFFGMSHIGGHIDIFVNGGRDQPGCGSSEVSRSINQRYLTSICHHRYALIYFMNSLLDKPHSCSMAALNVLDWETYVKTSALVENLAERYPLRATFLGITAVNYSARGKFWLYLVVSSDDFSDQVVPFDDRIQNMRALKPGKIFSALARVMKIPLKASTGEYPAIFPSFQDRITELTLDKEDLPNCGLFRAPSGARIRGGHPAYVGQFPWEVCIMVPKNDGPTWRQHCTGTILTERWVVTAAHCFKEENIDKWYAIASGIECPVNLEMVNVSRKFKYKPKSNVFNHNAYIRGQRWDIGLIRLEEPIVLPTSYDGGPLNSVCWRSANQFPYNRGDKLVFAGFGAKGPQVANDSLTWMDVAVSKDTDANLALALSDFQKPKFPGYAHFQSFELPPKMPCGGDSGGPYMWYVKGSSDTPKSNVSPYRAVIVATEVAGDACDFPVINEKTGLINRPETVTMVGQADVRAWMLDIVSKQTNIVNTGGHSARTLAFLRG
ncbi:Pancreatic lipase-related protein 2 [Halotydeus destructor]|nr:Pancreatic lipase-related protein 2 [Halotydeus destructor]